jgi:hypothetical protein
VTHKENNILQWWGYSAIYKQQKHCKFMLSWRWLWSICRIVLLCYKLWETCLWFYKWLLGKVFRDIQIEFFWVVTLCSDVAGYHHFRGLCCLHPSWRWRQHGPLKQYLTTALHSVTTQKNLTWNMIHSHTDFYSIA